MPSKPKQRSAPRTSLLQSESNLALESLAESSPIINVTVTDSLEGNSSISLTPLTISPVRLSRLVEKETLSSLNDRLAIYIDRVRHFEFDSDLLNGRIVELEKALEKGHMDLTSRYERRIDHLRSLIRNAVEEKTRLSIEAKDAAVELDALREKFLKLEEEKKELEKQRLSSDNMLRDLEARFTSLDNMRQKLEKEKQTLLADKIELWHALDVIRQQLEEATLSNITLLNENQSLKEDLDFLKKTREFQLEETQRMRQVGIATGAQNIERTFESHLQEQLRVLRLEFDGLLAKNKRDFEEAYKNKVNEATEASQQAAQAREESACLRFRLNELVKNAETKDCRINALQKRIAKLENEMRIAEKDTAVRLKQRDEFIIKLQQENFCMLKEYQDLLDLKVQIDTELKTYQSLLEQEETRLNISRQSFDSNASHGDSTSCYGVKRRRLSSSNENFCSDSAAETYKTTARSNSDIMIESHDPNGKFITLINKGQKTTSVAQWTVKSVANQKETVFKFNSHQSLKPGDTITVYSVNSGEKHIPPSQIVMKNQQWPAGGHIISTLLDANGVEVASLESIVETQIGYFGAANTDDPSQRCSVM